MARRYGDAVGQAGAALSQSLHHAASEPPLAWVPLRSPRGSTDGSRRASEMSMGASPPRSGVAVAGAALHPRLSGDGGVVDQLRLLLRAPSFGHARRSVGDAAATFSSVRAAARAQLDGEPQGARPGGEGPGALMAVLRLLHERGSVDGAAPPLPPPAPGRRASAASHGDDAEPGAAAQQGPGDVVMGEGGGGPRGEASAADAASLLSRRRALLLGTQMAAERAGLDLQQPSAAGWAGFAAAPGEGQPGSAQAGHVAGPAAREQGPSGGNLQHVLRLLAGARSMQAARAAGSISRDGTDGPDEPSHAWPGPDGSGALSPATAVHAHAGRSQSFSGVGLGAWPQGEALGSAVPARRDAHSAGLGPARPHSSVAAGVHCSPSADQSGDVCVAEPSDSGAVRQPSEAGEGTLEAMLSGRASFKRRRAEDALTGGASSGGPDGTALDVRQASSSGGGAATMDDARSPSA